MSQIASKRVARRGLLGFFLLGLACVALLDTGFGPTSAGAAPSAAQYQYTTFLGDWVSSEADGSVLTLKVAGAGGGVNVTFTDSIVNGFCSGEMVTAKGPGTISGTTLSTTMTAKCKKTKGTFGPFDFTFFDNGDGTLSGLGVTWTRP